MSYVKNNEIQTRIALKYDSFENWTSLNPILLAGEVAFATVSADSVAGYQNQPNVIIKVGDGVNHFNDLKTVSALAADVHGWAKEATKPAYDAIEIAYTDDKFVSANLQAVIAEIAAELDNLTGGTSGAGSIASQIAEAINSLDVALVEAGTGEVIGGIEEIDGKIVVSKKTLTKADIPTIEMTQVNGLGDAITGAETNAKAYADGLATNYDAKGSADQALTDAKAYTDSLAGNYDVKGAADAAKVAAIADAKAYADGLAVNYDTKGSAAAAETAAKAYADGLASHYDAAGTAAAKAAVAEANAKEYANSLAGNYDTKGSADAALASAKTYADGLAGNYDAAGTAETKASAAETAAKAYADSLAGNYDQAGAAATAEANAKAYADGLAGNYDAAGSAAAAETAAKKYADGLSANYDAIGSANSALTDAKAYADSLAPHYDPAGSAAQALADAKVDAQERIDLFEADLAYEDTAVQGQFVTRVTEANGIIAVERATINAGDVLLSTENYQNTNVAVAMDALKDYVNESSSSHVVTIAESNDTTDYAKVYTIKQGETVVGNINIPKDLVLKSGRVEDGHIVLVLNDENSTEISIDAGDLIEYVESGSQAGDMIVISIDADHKVTASITDGTVSKLKLAPAVQTSLGLADTALQKADITSGTTNGTIAVEGTDVAVTGLHAIAFSGDVKNLTQTADTYVVFNCGSASVNV